MMNMRLAILVSVGLMAVNGVSPAIAETGGPAWFGVPVVSEAAPIGELAQNGPPPPAMRYRSDQDAARRAMLDGAVMPFAMIKRRVEAQIGEDADYLGSEFIPERNRYRLKYMRDRNVVWVDVDGRTGDIIGWAGR